MTTPVLPAPQLLPPVLPAAPPRRWLSRGFSFLTSLVPVGGNLQKAPITAGEPRRRSDAGLTTQARDDSDYHPLPFPVASVSPAQARSIRHEWAASSRRREEELFEKEEDNVGSLGSLEAEVRRRTLLGPGHAAAEEARHVQAFARKSLSSSLNIGLTSHDVSLNYKRMGQFLDQARRASSPATEEKDEGKEEEGVYTLPSSFQRGGKQRGGSVVREFELEVLNAPAWDANSQVTALSRRSHAARAAAHSVLEAVRQLEQRHRLGHDDDADAYAVHSRPAQPPPSNRRKADKADKEALRLSQLRASLAFLHDADSDSADSDASLGSTGSASTG